jgi:predicted membrane channel-forming protein YqfA (hemolysin III family)
MSTFVSTLRIRRPLFGADQDAPIGDSYLSRLVKMIPAEALALYGAGAGVIPKDAAEPLIVWVVVCAAAIVAIRFRITTDQTRPSPQWLGIIISLGAFGIWVYSIGGPFYALHIKPENDYVGTLLVLGYTFFGPYLYKGD